MDDILEILNMPSWSDIGGLKTQLDGNPAGVPAELGSSSSVPEAASKVSKQELMSPPTLDSNRPRFLTRDRQDAQAGGSVDFHSDDSLLGAQLQHQLLSSTFPMETMQLGGSSSLGVNCNMMANQGSSGLPLLQSMHPGDTNSMLSTPSNFVLPSSSLGLVFDSRPWHQPYLGDVQPLMKTDMFSTSNNATNHLFATRYRDTGVPLSLRVNRDGTRGLFNAYAGAHLGQARQSVQGLQHQSNSSSRGSYRSHSGAQPPPINPIAGAPRPRVRARRGQATDPHSIAERQRRERIAERMKELQLLVPNANKTDKAIMLDEIIEYVKFLQIQMKIFGMSRIGSSGTVPSLLPSEFSNSIASTLSHSNGATSESLVNIERQVARLMDENMDSALQFLQSKGFCLMPISMASAMPTNCVHQPIFSGDKLETSTIVTERPGGSMMLLAGNANGSCTGKLGVAREGVDGTSASAGNETRQRSANSGNEEDQRRR